MIVAKIAILSLICISQVFALNLFDKSIDKRKSIISSKYFEIAFTEIDALREILSMAALDAYINDDNVQEVLQCILSTKDKFEALGNKMAKKTTALIKELKTKDELLITEYLKSLEFWLEYAAGVFEKLPKMVFKHIENKEYMEAYEIFINTGMAFIHTTEPFGDIVGHIAAKNNAISKKINQEMDDISQMAVAEAKVIRKDFIQCVGKYRPN